MQGPAAASPSHIRKLVLNAGSGPVTSRSFHRGFDPETWTSVRLDINPVLEPDVVGSVTDMRDHFPDASFDAVWSSHNLEHLRAHEVLPALLEFRRILKPTGFVLLTCPDLEAVAALVTHHGLDHVAYESAAGPITAHDMMFGHSSSIAAGEVYMAHNTGFSQDSLGRIAMEAGFEEAQVGKDHQFNLWALLLMPDAPEDVVVKCLRGTDAEFLLRFEAALQA